MKINIDTLETTTGWAVTGTSTMSQVFWPEFIASNLVSSSLFVFTTAGDVWSKTFSTPINITGCNNIAFNLKANVETKQQPISTDFVMKIRLYYSAIAYDEYYIPMTTQFLPVVFGNARTSIYRVDFICIQPVSFFASELIAYVDEMPIDIYKAIQQELVIAAAGYAKQIGIITCNAGDTQVSVSNINSIQQNAILNIGTEYHQVYSDYSAGLIRFTDYRDGKAMLNSYVNQPVYLLPEIKYNLDEYKAVIPGISISQGFNAEPCPYEISSPIIDSYSTTGTARVRRQETLYKHNILIEGMAETGSMNETILKILKKGCSPQRIVWINGRKHDLISEPIKQIEYGDATEILSKLQLNVQVEIGDEIWTQEIQPTHWNVTETVSTFIPVTL